MTKATLELASSERLNSGVTWDDLVDNLEIHTPWATALPSANDSETWSFLTQIYDACAVSSSLTQASGQITEEMILSQARLSPPHSRLTCMRVRWMPVPVCA